MLEGVVAGILNRFLSAYIDNLDYSQLNVGIWSGDVKLKNLKLKKSALDKFRLPVDVCEGYIGELTLSIPWSNLKGKPCKVSIDNIYLIALPNGLSSDNSDDLNEEEDELRAQQVKQERLENAELLLNSQTNSALSPEDEQKNQSFSNSLITKILNNLQVVIKNIHLRFEDNHSSNLNKKFSLGVTLSEISAISTNSDWIPTFIEDDFNQNGIHKLATLECLSGYFNENDESLLGLNNIELSIKRFNELISNNKNNLPDHQFILKPVSGQGRLILNKTINSQSPKFDVELLFDRFSFNLNEDQYKNSLLLLDLFHFQIRRNQYKKFRPKKNELSENKSKALLKFAGNAILSEIHERNYKWTWEYFKIRRNDRKRYVELFKLKKVNEVKFNNESLDEFSKLEFKLKYEDIRFYRSIARSELRKESFKKENGNNDQRTNDESNENSNENDENQQQQQQQQINEQQTKQSQQSGWLGWVWNATSSYVTGHDESQDQNNQKSNTTSLSEQQRKELYEAIEWDEKQALSSAIDLPRDAMKLRIKAKLNQGSFTLLKSYSEGKNEEIVSLIFNSLTSDIIRRTDNFEASFGLGNLTVNDNTNPLTIYPKVVRVKDDVKDDAKDENKDNQFFFFKWESKPLDNRSDKTLTLKMKHVEIIYHRGYVEAISKFFKPPESKLESINALIDVASESLDSFRKQTRAGFEYALSQHSTIDLRVDMNAPIIILPEDITQSNSQHLVLDAGHIAIESDLADKLTLQNFRSNLTNNDNNDIKANIESLMYDKFFLKLKSAQLLIGDDLSILLDVLENKNKKKDIDTDNYNIVEEINIDLNVKSSILPSAINLAKFIVSGHLPELTINVSDKKYQNMMRIIDVAIPNLNKDNNNNNNSNNNNKTNSTLFNKKVSSEEIFEIDDDNESYESDSVDNENFFEASEDAGDGSTSYRQQIFKLDFKVDKLQANLFRSNHEGHEKQLAEGILKGFYLGINYRQLDMHINVLLKSLSISNVEHNGIKTRLLNSESDNKINESLVNVNYFRVQPESPEFNSHFDGINQIVNADLTTLNLLARPEPIIELYAFIMETFVPTTNNEDNLNTNDEVNDKSVEKTNSNDKNVENEVTRKIKVNFKLSSIVFVLDDGLNQLGTLILSAGDVSILLDDTMKVLAKLGGIEITDDRQSDENFKQMLSIEGEELADFRYETFNVNDVENYPGYNSLVYLRTASLKFTYNEKSLNDVYKFLIRFARLKALYDAASRAAADAANDVNRMKYDINIKAPILILPEVASTNNNNLLNLRLGEFIAKNDFTGKEPGDIQHLHTGLNGINLNSSLVNDKGETEILPILDNVNLNFNFEIIEEVTNNKKKMNKIHGHMTDLKVALTQNQYASIYNIFYSIPKAFNCDDQNWEEDAEKLSLPDSKKNALINESINSDEDDNNNSKRSSVNLNPEILLNNEDNDIWTSTQLSFDIGMVSLELFSSQVKNLEDLKNNSISRFSLNDTQLKLKILSDGAMESELILKSLRMDDTRPQSKSKFRQLIPPAIHDGHQLMIHYSKSGGDNQSSLALLTIDSPKIIFSVDPLFALTNFFYSALPNDNNNASQNDNNNDNDDNYMDLDNIEDNNVHDNRNQQPSFAYRLNIVNTSIIILADETESTTEAIELAVKQVLMSQQGVLALKVEQLGMFLVRMDKSNDKLRFLDNFDFTLSLDSRNVELRQNTSIELRSDPIIFRSSYRDITLISNIFNKALELSTKSRGNDDNNDSLKTVNESNSLTLTSPNVDNVAPSTKPKVIITSENLKAIFEGFQIVLIEDLHELPLIHLASKKFTIDAWDWSSEMKLQTAISWSINYFNPTNSHWEPLMDPWDLTLRGEKLQPPGGMILTLSSRKRLEINLTSSFIQTALLFNSLISNNATRLLEKPRGSKAPFLLKNKTGYDIHIWATQDSTNYLNNSVNIKNNEEIPWRFDDLRTLREDVSASVHNSLGIQIDNNNKWDLISRISVDREGEHTYILKSKISKILHRVVVDIKLQDTFKVVTFRSSYLIENSTHLPIEIVIIGSNGKPIINSQKLVPGDKYSLPIEAAYDQRIKLRPNQGFEYNWSNESFYWQDLIKRPTRSITCRSLNQNEPLFRFQTCADFDNNDPLSHVYPKLTLRLRAPIEIENLLPFDIKFRMFDKNTKQDWSSFLRQGGVSPLHLIELSHLVLLSITIENSVFSPSEFAIINTDNPDDFPVENNLSLTDKERLKLNIRIHYYRYPKSGGAFKVQIYSPYVLYNKSGLDFSLRSKSMIGAGKNVAGQDLTSLKIKKRETSPFMFSHNSDDRQKRFLLRIDDSNWSKPISFDVAAADTELKLGAQSNQNVHIGMSVVEGNGKYKLSKVVTIQPRFLIKSQLQDQINVRVDRSLNSINLKPGERKALHRLEGLDEDERHMLKIAYPNSTNWSAPFSLTDVGPVHLRMNVNDDEHLVKADVYIEGPTIFIYLKRDLDPWPFKIENNSSTPIEIWQSTTEGYDNLSMMPGLLTKRYKVKPDSVMDYTWDAPAETDKKLRLKAPGGKDRSIDLMEIGALPPYRYSNDTLSVDVRADGARQVLVLSPYSQDESLYQPRRKSVARSEASDSVAGLFEEKSVETILNTQFNLELEGIGISVMNKRMQELFYASFRGIGFQYSDNNIHTTYNMSCKWIQIDNQLFGGLFPIILYPTTQPNDGRELERQPTLDSSIIVSKDSSHGVTRIEYLSFLLQSMTIEVDEDFLMALIDFSKFEGPSWDTQKEDCLNENPDEIIEPADLGTGMQLYFQVFHLQPISLDLSFMRTDRVNVDNKTSAHTRNPVMFFVNALTMALGNVSGAPIRLNSLILQNARFTSALLSQHVMIHYRDQFMYQLYRVLGSADFLGNPVGLFNNVSSGVADIFYEPYQGLVMHGNKELGIGIARGATSFVKKTVFGVTDSMSKVTGSIGKGLSAITLDQEYQSKRRMTQRRNKPKHALYGVTAGANAFAVSIASGFEGLALKPIEGAQRSGAGGFFKGVGRGLVGAVTKPVIGVFDLASNVTEGIRNTTTVFDPQDIDRIRLPRFIADDGILRAFNEREALGQSWLKNVENGKFFNESYVAHLNVRGSDAVFLLTTKRILEIQVRNLQLKWDIAFDDLHSISLENHGINLKLKGNIPGPFMNLTSQESRIWFFQRIQGVVNSYNYARSRPVERY